MVPLEGHDGYSCDDGGLVAAALALAPVESGLVLRRRRVPGATRRPGRQADQRQRAEQPQVHGRVSKATHWRKEMHRVEKKRKSSIWDVQEVQRSGSRLNSAACGEFRRLQNRGRSLLYGQHLLSDQGSASKFTNR
ncbi:hypothetical protein EYF80_050987 [Liparis tanakae]|uniref:Uncharacterized protein n=1 Tax=Liparis tanakae TaxID=230148 RepID=A0A4Z2FD85_9TELE|nr:hypothetical protein EYF80_050987 [Liparis tanakae]